MDGILSSLYEKENPDKQQYLTAFELSFPKPNLDLDEMGKINFIKNKLIDYKIEKNLKKLESKKFKKTLVAHEAKKKKNRGVKEGIIKDVLFDDALQFVESECWVCPKENSQLVAYCGCGVHGSKRTKCERMLCKLHFTSNCHMHNQEKKLAEVCKTCGMLLNSFSTLTNRMLLSL